MDKRILQETYTNLILRGFATAPDIRDLHAALRTHFADAWIDQNDVDDLLVRMMNDRKDRHVLAAAVLAGAPLIVTNNVRDFPSSACEPHGVSALNADDYLADLAMGWPTAVEEGLHRYAAVLRRPHPWSLEELLGALTHPGRLPRFANQAAINASVTPLPPPDL